MHFSLKRYRWILVWYKKKIKYRLKTESRFSKKETTFSSLDQLSRSIKGHELMHKIQFQTFSKSPNIQRCSSKQISPDPVLTNTEINLFVQGNLLFFINRCQGCRMLLRNVEGNKLTTKLISAWSKFPISFSHLSMHMCNISTVVFHVGVIFYLWKKIMCMRERYLYIFLKMCRLPSDKYPDSQRLNKFSRYVNKNGIQSHKSHRFFFFFYSKNRKQSQVTSNFHVDKIFFFFVVLAWKIPIFLQTFKVLLVIRL